VGRRLLFLVALASALATAGTAVHGRDLIELRMRGYFFAAPATVAVTVDIEPGADNRTLRLEADGQDMFRSTEVTLIGANDKRIHTIVFKNLSAGNYQLRAEVLSVHGVIGRAEHAMVVTGVGAEPD
jgi:hypothetical protein